QFTGTGADVGGFTGRGGGAHTTVRIRTYTLQNITGYQQKLVRPAGFGAGGHAQLPLFSGGADNRIDNGFGLGVAGAALLFNLARLHHTPDILRRETITVNRRAGGAQGCDVGG